MTSAAETANRSTSGDSSITAWGGRLSRGNTRRNAAVPADQLRARARAAADAVAARPPAAVVITKALMRDGEAIAARMDEEGTHFAAQLKSPEAKEAFAAFAEKRAPDFGKVA